MPLRITSSSPRELQCLTAHELGLGQLFINRIVHLMTELPPDSTVPIGWVAVGQPASILPTSEHDEIWAAQEPLKFPQRVFGVERSKPGMSKMPELCSRYTKLLAGHDHDVLLPDRKEDETV